MLEPWVAHEPLGVRGWGTVFGRIVDGIGRCPSVHVASPKLGQVDLFLIITSRMKIKRFQQRPC
jgi:hypothetical protein